MPEIWLGYGESEVILDIKYENILRIAKPVFNSLTIESLNNELENKLKLNESTIILVLTPFVYMVPILSYINTKCQEFRFEMIEYDILSKVFPYSVRQMLVEKGIILNKLDNKDIIERIGRFKNVIVVDKIEYDPVFGYTGSPIKLFRECYPDGMSQVYSSLIDTMPQPGKYNEALKLAVEHTEKLNVQAINVVSNGDGINSIFTGDQVYSFNESTKQFRLLTQPTCDISKSAFISGNTSFTSQSTLSNSLNLLWNNCHSVRDNGTIVLLSENKNGVGDGALVKLIENRLNLDGLENHHYIKDLEHVNFLKLLKDKYEIVLISTLPQVYTNKLGLKTVPKIKDGLQKIIEKYGKYSKSLIIPNSEITFLNCTK